MILFTCYIIFFLAICILIFYYIYQIKQKLGTNTENFASKRLGTMSSTDTSNTNNLSDSNYLGYTSNAPTDQPLSEDPNLITVKNDAQIRAKYSFDEKRDESQINFNVKIPQNLVSTYDINDTTYGSYVPYQLKGFCNAPNATSETIEAKCNQFDQNVCSTTSCCVLLGGTKCVAGDERGPTFQQDFNDPSVSYPDRYYYMGNCYGNCSNYMVANYNQIYKPSSLSISDMYVGDQTAFNMGYLPTPMSTDYQPLMNINYVTQTPNVVNITPMPSSAPTIAYNKDYVTPPPNK